MNTRWFPTTCAGLLHVGHSKNARSGRTNLRSHWKSPADQTVRKKTLAQASIGLESHSNLRAERSCC